MKRPYLGLVLALILTSTIEIGLLWPVPNLLLAFHLSYVVIAAVTLIGDWQKTLWYALIQGLVLDIYSPQVFGLYLCTAIVLTVAIVSLQATWLKQASLLSVATISGLSFLIAQMVIWIWQWGSETLHLTDLRLFASRSLLTSFVSWFIMVLLTALIVRLLSPRYEKLL